MIRRKLYPIACRLPPDSLHGPSGEMLGAWWRDTARVPGSSPAKKRPSGADSGRQQCLRWRQGAGQPPGGAGRGSLPVPSCDGALARRTLCTVSPNPPGNRGPGWNPLAKRFRLSIAQVSSSLMPARAERQYRSVFPGASGLGLGLAFGL